MTNQTEHPVVDLLRGFGRGNEAVLDQLADVPDWPRLARAELERRATIIVQTLDEETLRAIANGSLEFSDLCRQVSSQLRRGA